MRCSSVFGQKCIHTGGGVTTIDWFTGESPKQGFDAAPVPLLRPTSDHCVHCQQRNKPIFMFSVCTHYTQASARGPASYSLDIIIKTAKVPPRCMIRWINSMSFGTQNLHCYKYLYETYLCGHWLIKPQILSTTGNFELIFHPENRESLSYCPHLNYKSLVPVKWFMLFFFFLSTQSSCPGRATLILRSTSSPRTLCISHQDDLLVSACWQSLRRLMFSHKYTLHQRSLLFKV